MTARTTTPSAGAARRVRHIGYRHPVSARATSDLLTRGGRRF